MYLMNVPPVAVTETEWRRCVPPGGYSLPVCFNDSDTESSTRGTPITDKVQMIIESLRSTQSSLKMGDEIEENMLSGQEGHAKIYKAAVGSYIAAKSKGKSSMENPRARFPSINHQESSDSDSDDSVDRGIEEAILEYLKEKDGHKFKTEPATAFLQPPKIPRTNPPTLEMSNQNPEGNTSLIPSSHFPINIKPETQTVTASVPLKKYIKNKVCLEESFDFNKDSIRNFVTKKSPLETTSPVNKTVIYSAKRKIEEDSDSSSDDGIEEAIQTYQLEKEKKEKKHEAFSSLAYAPLALSLKEESDSTSDDGIEEAIRCYQLEQLRESNLQKPFLNSNTSSNKTLIHAVGKPNSESTKKQKRKRKRAQTEKHMKSFHTHASPVSQSKTPLSYGHTSKDNGLFSLGVERLKDQADPAPPKVNTTAELMCAEAILDISKTVMPVGFHQSIGLSSFSPMIPSVHSSPPHKKPNEECSDSSIDSEDGIEQEIRKFLEQKAQLHKQPPTAQDPQSIDEPENMKGGEVSTQKMPQRLSLTQRRKQRQKNSTMPVFVGSHDKAKETTSETSEFVKESCPSAISQKRQMHHVMPMHRADQSEDKSSSLDSDEDLDTAIKDLLKTKKKTKKRNRDVRKKPKKGNKDEEPQTENLPSKKYAHEPPPKGRIFKKVHLSMQERVREDEAKKSPLQQKLTEKIKENNGNERTTVETAKCLTGEEEHSSLQRAATFPQIKDDSSSVDSDDSIEQEIRKFLAEKAKVSDKSQQAVVGSNWTVAVNDVQLGHLDIKPEPQLAEIQPKVLLPTSAVQDKSPPTCLPDNSSVSPQSCASSVQSCSLLEPADGAGASRNQQRGPNTDGASVQDGTPHVEKSRPPLNSNAARSLAESIKWRQSLGLPIINPRAISRTPFHITSSEGKGTVSQAPSFQNGDPKAQTPASGWFSSRANRAPFSCSVESPVNTTVRPPILKFFSAASRPSRATFTQSLTPSHRSQFSSGEERASTVHVPKDKSVFVELESNRTNHVQVQSRDSGEGKERADALKERKREGKSVKIEQEEVHQDRKDEEFIDESDCESGSREDPDQKQGFPALSLSRAIDPGVTFSPCVALTSDERGKMIRSRYLVGKCLKPCLEKNASISRVSEDGKTLKSVKRKLQFSDVGKKS